MDGLVGGHKRQSVGQFKPFLTQTARFTDTGDTQGGFMDELKSQSGFDGATGSASPSGEKIPRSQPHMFRNQEPEAHQSAGDLVGQELAYTPFDARRVTGFSVSGAFCALRFI